MKSAFAARSPIDVLHLAYKYLPKTLRGPQGSTEVLAIVERCLREHGIEPDSAVLSETGFHVPEDER